MRMYAVVRNGTVESLHRWETEAWIACEGWAEAEIPTWVYIVEVTLGKLVNITTKKGQALADTDLSRKTREAIAEHERRAVA